MRPNSNLRRIIFTCVPLLILLAVLIYPFETVIVPAWKIRVVDKDGKPVKDDFVKQVWKHYSLELDPGENSEDRRSDDDGYVVFPARTIRASLLKRAVVPALNGLRLQEHASFGPRAYVIVWGTDGSPQAVNYDQNKPLPTEITLPEFKENRR